MTRLAACAVAVALGAAGCCLFDGGKLGRQKAAPPTFSRYNLEGWDWANVDRVLILPVLNESEHTNAGDELRAALASELQRLGRFEVVSTAPEERAVLAAKVHRGGRFDEAAMLDIAAFTNADVVVHVTVTQYSPYHPRQRLGLVVQAVGPQQAKVVASVDGLWDTTDAAVADRCRVYYRQRIRPRPPWIRNNVIASEDSVAEELSMISPALFQRWVCHEVALTLLGLPVPGVLMPDANSQAVAVAGAASGAQPNCPAPVAPAAKGPVK